jgi:hypothetical protein
MQKVDNIDPSFRVDAFHLTIICEDFSVHPEVNIIMRRSEDKVVAGNLRLLKNEHHIRQLASLPQGIQLFESLNAD